MPRLLATIPHGQFAPQSIRSENPQDSFKTLAVAYRGTPASLETLALEEASLDLPPVQCLSSTARQAIGSFLGEILAYLSMSLGMTSDILTDFRCG